MISGNAKLSESLVAHARPMATPLRVFLSDFSSIRPKHESAQGRALLWLAAAHAKSDKTSSRESAGQDDARMGKLFSRYGCGPDKISKRGHELDDFLHENWEKMAIYNLHESSRGSGMEARTLYYAQAADRIFESFYPWGCVPPNDLIHVTCTGYASPSGAQKIVARRGWRETKVTHAYHMGCCAAFPALRMARGFAPYSKKTDIVHTEICSLHLDPSLHMPEQLVLQSLFADGFSKYSSFAIEDGQHAPVHALELLALKEEILPDSEQDMEWFCSDWGMRMHLSKGVPAKIGKTLSNFVSELFREADIDQAENIADAVFAVHPGGPKILDQVQEILELKESQMAASKEALFRFGNMSSATLPHIWQALVDDPAISRGTTIVSLAFGPGLTLCGGMLRKT